MACLLLTIKKGNVAIDRRGIKNHIVNKNFAIFFQKEFILATMMMTKSILKFKVTVITPENIGALLIIFVT